MEDSRKIPATFSQAANPRQWLAEYLRHRAGLASHKSDFHCDPACTRPGCKNQDLQIPVSIIDLVGAAIHRDMSVAATYHGSLSREGSVYPLVPKLRLGTRLAPSLALPKHSLGHKDVPKCNLGTRNEERGLPAAEKGGPCPADILSGGTGFPA